MENSRANYRAGSRKAVKKKKQKTKLKQRRVFPKGEVLCEGYRRKTRAAPLEWQFFARATRWFGLVGWFLTCFSWRSVFRRAWTLVSSFKNACTTSPNQPRLQPLGKCSPNSRFRLTRAFSFRGPCVPRLEVVAIWFYHPISVRVDEFSSIIARFDFSTFRALLKKLAGVHYFSLTRHRYVFYV